MPPTSTVFSKLAHIPQDAVRPDKKFTEETSVCRNRKAKSGLFAETYAARPAPVVAVEPINWYYELISTRRLENSSHVAPNVSAPGKSMRTSAASCGCNASNGRETTMRILLSPFHYVLTKRARRRQVRKVLQMLSVSGVVRPGHIEPHYVIGTNRVDALYR